MKLTVEITGAQEKQLADVACRLNVPAHQLAEALVRDLLSQREADFSEAAARVLEKNRELYQRLHLFSAFCPPGSPTDVADPFERGDEHYERALDQIEAGCRGLLAALRDQALPDRAHPARS